MRVIARIDVGCVHHECNLWVLLDGNDGPDRQPDGLLVVHVDELGVSSRGVPAALDPADLCKKSI